MALTSWRVCPQSTVAIGLHDRLVTTGEKIVWLPCCQEISRNPDTLCITPAKGPAKPAMTDVAYGASLKKPFQPVDMAAAWSTFMDLSQHTGEKPLKGTGGQRLHAFADWAFTKAFSGKQNHPSPCIIVGGHSLWFRCEPTAARVCHLWCHPRVMLQCFIYPELTDRVMMIVCFCAGRSSVSSFRTRRQRHTACRLRTRR